MSTGTSARRASARIARSRSMPLASGISTSSTTSAASVVATAARSSAPLDATSTCTPSCSASVRSSRSIMASSSTRSTVVLPSVGLSERSSSRSRISLATVATSSTAAAPGAVNVSGDDASRRRTNGAPWKAGPATMGATASMPMMPHGATSAEVWAPSSAPICSTAKPRWTPSATSRSATPSARPISSSRRAFGASSSTVAAITLSSARANRTTMPDRRFRSSAGSLLHRRTTPSIAPVMRLASWKPRLPAVPCTRCNSRRSAFSRSSDAGLADSCSPICSNVAMMPRLVFA